MTTKPAFAPAWETALTALYGRMREIHAQIGDRWPYHCDPAMGEWDTSEDGDWCGGHWVERLRLVGALERDQRLLDEAVERTERLRPDLERDDMFRGPRFFYAAARQDAWTGEERFRTLALAAAWAVRSMAIPINGAMPIGTQVQVRSTRLLRRHIVCVDNVHPSLILDWWAWKQLGDDTFVRGARRHLDLSAKVFVREDGSTLEFVDFDIESGRVLRHDTLLGAPADSCWNRGQAWAIAGSLRAFEELRDDRYLMVARRLFDDWGERTGPAGVPPWDFMDPLLQRDPDQVPCDTSAAAVVVEGLARLARQEDRTPDATELVARLGPRLDGLLQHRTLPGDGSGLPRGILGEAVSTDRRAMLCAAN